MPEGDFEMSNNGKRIRLWVSYDGTNYHGWQVQNNGITIESELNRALTELYRQEIKVIGASRTDAGVHALGNVAIFDVNSPIPAEKVCYALNARLPEDIRVTRSEEVPRDWHPRKCESRKTYEYRIYLGEILPPVKRLYCHHVYRPLDVEAMQRAAAFLVGEHDFKSFCSAGSQAKSTVRTIYNLDIDKDGDMITIVIRGNGFLYNMVRIIVGTLIKVGLGVYPPEHVEEIMAAKDRGMAGQTVAAQGLTLVGIEYLE